MIKRLTHRFIDRASRSLHNQLVNSNDEVNTTRFHFFRPDEYWLDSRGLVNALPWWLPFNMFLHRWDTGDDGLLHDHPRWSITVVLQGALVEETPTKYRWLTPGSVVFRSRKYIHRIITPKKYQGETYTLFIVGRRRYKQTYYTPDGRPTDEFPKELTL